MGRVLVLELMSSEIYKQLQELQSGIEAMNTADAEISSVHCV